MWWRTWTRNRLVKQIGISKCKPPGLICMWCIADCFGNTLISKWICLQHNSVPGLLQKQGAYFLSLSLYRFQWLFLIHRAEFQEDKCVSHDYLLNYEMEHFRIRLYYPFVAPHLSIFLLSLSFTLIFDQFLLLFPNSCSSFFLLLVFIFSFLGGCNTITGLNLTLSECLASWLMCLTG